MPARLAARTRALAPHLGAAATRAAAAGTRVRRMAAAVGSGRRELAIALSAYGVYALVKGLFAGSLAEGVANARGVIDAERALGILVEDDAQRAFVEHGLGMAFWNWFYLASQVVVLPVTLILVFLLARHAYAHLRNLAIAAWCGGLVWYGLQPVAPPRHVGIGIADTISTQTAFDLDGGFARLFYNPVAAMPSLHVGMAPVVGWALWRLTPYALTRALGVAYPLLVSLTVVVTGNHYLLDIAGGLAVVLGAAIVSRILTGPAAAPRGAGRRVRALPRPVRRRT
ncbi:MAG: phosphatase PAP2 family protein [Actinomycetota bacterium]